jgi:hypothetical protein
MIRIHEPFHGAVLNHRHGAKVRGGLRIAVRGSAPLGAPVTVNGAAACRIGRNFAASLILRARETDIVAVSRDSRGRTEHRVRVVWDRHSVPRYRFSIDDNSFFLRDIAAKGYQSLFDCFYLAGLRKLHRRYGAKFVLNCFYTTPENDFNLAQFPKRYRSEWGDNADWLSLTFHAYAEFPDRPYHYASAEKLGKDLDLVANEIIRFAGKAAWSTPTVIHWGMVHPTALPALTRRGVRVLSGMFAPDTGSHYTTDDEAPSDRAPFGYDVNYNLDNVRSEYLSRHDALKDFESGVVFSRGDLTCNNVPVKKIVPTLDALTRDPNTAEIMDLFTHEQYFWPFYFNHRPDHFQRLDAALRFCTERGYRPVFFHEGFLGGRE